MDRRLLSACLFILVFPVLVLSRGLLWPQGWAFDLWLLALSCGTILYLYRRDPAILDERYRQPRAENQAG